MMKNEMIIFLHCVVWSCINIVVYGCGDDDNYNSSQFVKYDVGSDENFCRSSNNVFAELEDYAETKIIGKNQTDEVSSINILVSDEEEEKNNKEIITTSISEKLGLFSSEGEDDYSGKKNQHQPGCLKDVSSLKEYIEFDKSAVRMVEVEIEDAILETNIEKELIQEKIMNLWTTNNFSSSSNLLPGNSQISLTEDDYYRKLSEIYGNVTMNKLRRTKSSVNTRRFNNSSVLVVEQDESILSEEVVVDPSDDDEVLVHDDGDIINPNVHLLSVDPPLWIIDNALFATELHKIMKTDLATPGKNEFAPQSDTSVLYCDSQQKKALTSVLSMSSFPDTLREFLGPLVLEEDDYYIMKDPIDEINTKNSSWTTIINNNTTSIKEFQKNDDLVNLKKKSSETILITSSSSSLFDDSKSGKTSDDDGHRDDDDDDDSDNRSSVAFTQKSSSSTTSTSDSGLLDVDPITGLIATKSGVVGKLTVKEYDRPPMWDDYYSTSSSNGPDEVLSVGTTNNHITTTIRNNSKEGDQDFNTGKQFFSENLFFDELVENHEDDEDDESSQYSNYRPTGRLHLDRVVEPGDKRHFQSMKFTVITTYDNNGGLFFPYARALQIYKGSSIYEGSSSSSSHVGKSSSTTSVTLSTQEIMNKLKRRSLPKGVIYRDWNLQREYERKYWKNADKKKNITQQVAEEYLEDMKYDDDKKSHHHKGLFIKSQPGIIKLLLNFLVLMRSIIDVEGCSKIVGIRFQNMIPRRHSNGVILLFGAR